ncbi:MAG: alpha-L-fucosidase [Kiritimatiellae bacterium]|jgi:alpha-L-fucosidase|nr:alpha-L-fucosidase [Kiritimatiellia bacterium]
MKHCIPLLLLACSIMAAPTPTPEQLAWQKMELTMFCHFGVNTFTDREWGKGNEDEKIFNPTDLDCNQWVQAAKTGGFKLMILTAKHHDGFCLWPSAYTQHSVKSSPWKGGKGDVVQEFITACRKENIKTGLYLSPWDRHEKSYGTDAYNDYFCNQLTELLSNYGQIDEVWFDGACGEGPNGKKQVYDWDRYFALIRKLQPKALIAISGPDIRWVGNESGFARVGESSVRTRGGKPVWYPAECDVSIRPGWFYHAAQDDKVKSIEHLMDIYFKSVGRNSVLLLNVPPDRRGRFAAPDVQRLKKFGKTVRGLYSNVIAKGTVKENSCLLEFDNQKSITLVNLQEDIAQGERVKIYRIDVRNGREWKTVARGTVIGQRNLLRIEEVKTDAIRLVIEKSSADPRVTMSVFNATPIGPWANMSSFALTPGKPAKASDVHGNNTQYGGDKAVDGDRNTRWATSDATRACILNVDLLHEENISRVAISELEPRITKFQIEYRTDDTQPWQVAFAGTKAGKEFKAKFTPVKARYVRLNILDASFAPSIWEFELF